MTRDHRHLPLIIISLVLAGSSIMCSIFTMGNSQKVTPGEKSATITSLQLTVAKLEKQAITPTIEPTDPITFPTMVKPETGNISGTLSYPSEQIPPLRIVAINIKTGEYYATEVTDNNLYGLDGIPTGTYHVIAYQLTESGTTMNMAGGYTKYVTCGMSVECTDHSLVDVAVEAGKLTTGIDPADWYAPQGTVPPAPSQ